MRRAGACLGARGWRVRRSEGDFIKDGGPLVFSWKAGDDPLFLWLVTNGLGGYASESLFGVATRRYHGLFVPNLPAPKGPTVMIPRLDEHVQCGDRTVWLGGAEHADGRLEGDGHEVLERFQ